MMQLAMIVQLEQARSVVAVQAALLCSPTGQAPEHWWHVPPSRSKPAAHWVQVASDAPVHCWAVQLSIGAHDAQVMSLVAVQAPV